MVGILLTKKYIRNLKVESYVLLSGNVQTTSPLLQNSYISYPSSPPPLLGAVLRVT